MSKLTLVSVVFDSEVILLELQAHSIRLYVDPDSVERILILDNCLFGLGARRRGRLLKAYGSFATRVAFVRTKDLFDPRATTGWRSQQAAKLLVSAHITTSDYVALDAKNHFTRRVRSSDFVGDDGRAHGRSHSYSNHPLRSSLVRTLEYLGANEQAAAGAIAAFPPTATPFVLRTAVVRQMIADIEESSGRSFASEFESHRLLEFFLYSAWVSVRGPGLQALRDEHPLPSPTVWPKARDISGVAAAISEATASRAFVFAVHRQALAHADRPAVDLIANHWSTVGLFRNHAYAHAFVRRFRRSYLPTLAMTRGAERVQKVLMRFR